jgi:hypothetical protein
MGKEDQKSPLPMTRPLSPLLHPLLYLLSHPNIQNLLMDVSFKRYWQEEGKSMSPSRFQN